MKKFIALSIQEMEFKDGDSEDADTGVLNMMLIYDGDITNQATNTKHKKHKRKIKKWDKKAHKALRIILQSLHPSLLLFVSQETNPHKVYLVLYKCYQLQSHSYTFLLFKQLHTLKMGPNNTMHAYINQATGIAVKLHAARCKFSNSMIMLHIIYSLTPNYCQLHSAINMATSQHSLTLHWLTQAHNTSTHS